MKVDRDLMKVIRTGHYAHKREQRAAQKAKVAQLRKEIESGIIVGLCMGFGVLTIVLGIIVS